MSEIKIQVTLKFDKINGNLLELLCKVVIL